MRLTNSAEEKQTIKIVIQLAKWPKYLYNFLFGTYFS